MSENRDFRREVRDTILKSGFGGVAATVLAVTLSSPAGLGGMIGTSLASGATDSASDSDAYANLPAYPAPLTAAEVAEIRGQLSATAASLALTREATDDTIEHIRSIAAGADAVTFAPQVARAAAPTGLRSTFSAVEPVADATQVMPVAYVQPAAPVDANLELATLLFSYDSL